MQRWKRYFRELLNKENQYEIEDHLKVEGPIMGVTEKEVEVALHKMKKGKAPGPSGVTADILKYAGVRSGSIATNEVHPRCGCCAKQSKTHFVILGKVKI